MATTVWQSEGSVANGSSNVIGDAKCERAGSGSNDPHDRRAIIDNEGPFLNPPSAADIGDRDDRLSATCWKSWEASDVVGFVIDALPANAGLRNAGTPAATRLDRKIPRVAADKRCLGRNQRGPVSDTQ